MKTAIADTLFIFWRAFIEPSAFWKFILGVTSVAAAFMFPSEAASYFALSAGSLIALDTVSGLLASMREGHSITSAKSRRVFYKIVGYSMLVVVARVVGEAIPLTIPNSSKETSLICAAAAVCWMLAFVIFTEAISILENVRRMGVAVPPLFSQRLRDILKKQYQEKEDNGNSINGNNRTG